MSLYEIGVQPTLGKPRKLTVSELHRQVAELEQRFEMSTEVFCKRWNAGELPESQPFSNWYRLTTIISLTK